MWDPTVALGTVTHEYIGYLLPMGPFYCGRRRPARARLGGPAAVAGRHPVRRRGRVLYLCRVVGAPRPGAVRGRRSAFMFSPYVLQYAGRISVILLPWAGLPWLVALAILALRHGGWRYPALFALVVALVSGINASSIIYVGMAPALWLLYAVLVEREATWRQRLGGRLADRRSSPPLSRCGGSSAWQVEARLRRQHPQVHRDGPGDQRHLAGLRGASGGSATGTSTAATGWAVDLSRRSSTPSSSG